MDYLQNQIKEVILKEKINSMDEVLIFGNRLDPYDILKKAKSKIKHNFVQGPYNQEIFFRMINYEDDSVVFKEESNILLYDENGYKSRNHPYENMYGEILSFKNSSKNSVGEKWDGVGALWLSIYRNVVLSKNNVLHKPRYYELEIGDIYEYDNYEIYKIEFRCLKPIVASTGYGYPAPISAWGYVYITSEDYSVIEYEMIIDRSNMQDKRDKNNNIICQKIRIFQKFKKNNTGSLYCNYSQLYVNSNVENERNQITRNYYKFQEFSSYYFTNDADELTMLKTPLIDIKNGLQLKNKGKENWLNKNYLPESNNLMRLCN
jgi:hypothetical protein